MNIGPKFFSTQRVTLINPKAILLKRRNIKSSIYQTACCEYPDTSACTKIFNSLFKFEQGKKKRKKKEIASQCKVTKFSFQFTALGYTANKLQKKHKIRAGTQSWIEHQFGPYTLKPCNCTIELLNPAFSLRSSLSREARKVKSK